MKKMRGFLYALATNPLKLQGNDVHRLTTRVRPENCVIRWFRHSASQSVYTQAKMAATSLGDADLWGHCHIRELSH